MAGLQQKCDGNQTTKASPRTCHLKGTERLENGTGFGWSIVLQSWIHTGSQGVKKKKQSHSGGRQGVMFSLALAFQIPTSYTTVPEFVLSSAACLRFPANAILTR